MKRVILTIGPQYAGKSTFCEKVATTYPEVVLISRDKILIQMFGTVWLNSYTGGHYAALDEMWREVEKHLTLPDLDEQTLILDVWNGPPEDRTSIVHKLRQFGASRVEGWHFVTPLKNCIKWSFERDPIEIKNEWSKLRREMRIETYSNIHKKFCGWNIDMEKVFDSVRRLNALEAIPNDLFPISA